MTSNERTGLRTLVVEAAVAVENRAFCRGEDVEERYAQADVRDDL